MPRTIEGIVQSHRDATALRKAGKPIWSETIDIKSILRENQEAEDSETLVGKAHAIGNAVRAAVPKDNLDHTNKDANWDFIELVENLESYSVVEMDQMEPDDRLSMLNGHIDELYDWADANRVWMGA